LSPNELRFTHEQNVRLQIAGAVATQFSLGRPHSVQLAGMGATQFPLGQPGAGAGGIVAVQLPPGNLDPASLAEQQSAAAPAEPLNNLLRVNLRGVVAQLVHQRGNRRKDPASFWCSMSHLTNCASAACPGAWSRAQPALSPLPGSAPRSPSDSAPGGSRDTAHPAPAPGCRRSRKERVHHSPRGLDRRLGLRLGHQVGHRHLHNIV